MANARNKQRRSEEIPGVDDIDRDIVAILQTDGRRSFTRVAQEVGVSESVVRYRVQRMERAGVLQIVAVADPLKVGFDFMCFLGIKVTPGRLNDVIASVSEIDEASYVASLAGSLDLIVEVICRDTAHFADVLNEKFQVIDGVVDVQTFVELGIHKMSYGWSTAQRRAAAADADLAADGE